MVLDFLYRRFDEAAGKTAFCWGEREKSYAALRRSAQDAAASLEAEGIGAGEVVLLKGASIPATLEAFLALVQLGCIVVPLDPAMGEPEADRIAEVVRSDAEVQVDEQRIASNRLGCDRRAAPHPLVEGLQRRGTPGLILLTTGSSGEPKAVLHDFERLLVKYHRRGRDFRTLAFLQLDHIGGVDTFFHGLSNTSTLILPADRSPDGVCAAVERHRAEVLPVTPSFLNLLFLSEAHRRHDLSSLRIITYGAEVMPEQTLERCAEVFAPTVELVQKYGTTETGALRSRSRDSHSLWVRVGGPEFATRVVEGKLQIQAETSMLGYLNSEESPFTEDGWFRTGDRVACDGEYLLFLGRESDVINVGGTKVDPAAVEAFLRNLPNIADVVVYGEANALLGQIVCAQLQLLAPEEEWAVTRRVQEACREHLERHQVPVRVVAGTEPLPTRRFKKLRRRKGAEAE